MKPMFVKICAAVGLFGACATAMAAVSGSCCTSIACCLQMLGCCP